MPFTPPQQSRAIRHEEIPMASQSMSDSKLLAIVLGNKAEATVFRNQASALLYTALGLDPHAATIATQLQIVKQQVADGTAVQDEFDQLYAEFCKTRIGKMHSSITFEGSLELLV